MSPRLPKLKASARAPRARPAHGRQRQRLIDACISALHLYGPSRTTVEKVVAIAKMSPGIVRFYFNSKAAMLVASLEFLAAEFEERVMVPVAQLKSTPVAALERMVDLYLDPDIASPRKVSVWYAFWGEASSRQEYYDICGQKDDSFAALVRELIERLIVETDQPHLDPDGIALGFIGALEILWQEFAFLTEPEIDRPAARRRCMAYLRSVFPGQYTHPRPHAAPEAHAEAAPRPPGAGRSNGGFHTDARMHAIERERLFHGVWTAVGHESQVARPREFIAADFGADRVVVLRDQSGTLRALRNSCPESPHVLVAGRGGRMEGIECKLHGLRFSLEGRHAPGSGRSDLAVLDLAVVEGLLLVRSASGPRGAGPDPRAWFAPQTEGLRVLGPAVELPVAADWKVVVELWLGLLEQCAAGRTDPPGAQADVLRWQGWNADEAGWSARRYRRLVADSHSGSRTFIAPNQIVETRPDGLTVLQALPVARGRCRVRRLDYSCIGVDPVARAGLYLAHRMAPFSRRATLDAAESIQQGLTEFGYPVAAAAGSSAVGWFRHRLQQLIPELEGGS